MPVSQSAVSVSGILFGTRAPNNRRMLPGKGPERHSGDQFRKRFAVPVGSQGEIVMKALQAIPRDRAWSIIEGWINTKFGIDTVDRDRDMSENIFYEGPERSCVRLCMYLPFSPATKPDTDPSIHGGVKERKFEVYEE